MTIPAKPFPSFKWRWLSVQPSEGLLKSPVFLGVLRALLTHEGEPFSSKSLKDTLEKVETETKSTVTLARDTARNLFRNSGQYWRGTGLVLNSPGQITLTGLGRRVATGAITNDEFVSLMVSNTVLPNPLTYDEGELAIWRAAKVRIKPFELILAVIAHIGKKNGVAESFLTPNELIKVVIPMSGENANAEIISEKVFTFRRGKLDISSWPNCAPAANDRRLAREFLLFLQNFDVLKGDENTTSYDQRFALSEVVSELENIDERPTFTEEADKIEVEIAAARSTVLPQITERNRIMTSVLQRPNQAGFRRDVLKIAKGKCLFTEEDTLEVLEAAHIIPVGHGGSDVGQNGLCLRVDIHRLFDNGKIRLSPVGEVHLHHELLNSPSYKYLPKTVSLPDSALAQNLEWRNRYL